MFIYLKYKKCHLLGNIFHHCHNTHLALVHINADVNVHHLCCPRTDSELWMEVMATAAVTSVSSKTSQWNHGNNMWHEQHQQHQSRHAGIRIYLSLFSHKNVHDLLNHWSQAHAFNWTLYRELHHDAKKWMHIFVNLSLQVRTWQLHIPILLWEVNMNIYTLINMEIHNSFCVYNHVPSSTYPTIRHCFPAVFTMKMNIYLNRRWKTEYRHLWEGGWKSKM